MAEFNYWWMRFLMCIDSYPELICKTTRHWDKESRQHIDGIQILGMRYKIFGVTIYKSKKQNRLTWKANQ